MRYRIVFHSGAIRELADLPDFIAETSGVRRADSFVGSIRDYCLGFETFPERGLRRDDISAGLRVVGFRRRVSIAFRVDEERVTILGVYYGDATSDRCQSTKPSSPAPRLDPAKPLPHGPPALPTRRPGLNYDLLLPLAALPFPKIDPVIVQIGPLAIHWYGLGYIVGILFAWWYARRLIANQRLWPAGQAPLKPDDIDDFLVWAAVGVVAGGRIGYILFYDLQRYIANPQDILAVWQGGMSFHGGFLGTTLVMILFARRRGVSTWTLFDVVSAGVPVALGLVRIANFVNSELWGKLTSVPWAFEFPNGGPFPRHPTQLYEAGLEGLVLFLVLGVLTHRYLKLGSPGFVCGAFVAGYGLARILVEFFREPDQQIGYLLGGWLTMGMVLSAPMVLAGIWAMATARPAAEPARA